MTEIKTILRLSIWTMAFWYCAMITGQADEFRVNGPLPARTFNPVYLMSLGQNPHRAVVLSGKEIRTGIDFSYGNLVEFDQSGYNEVRLDMELARLQINLACGLGRGFETEIQIPFSYGHKGFFDGIVDHYHKSLDLPEGQRNLVPDDMFTYKLTQENETFYQLTDMEPGLNDIVLGVRKSIIIEKNNLPGFTCGLRLKFPTGDSSKGFGSGGFDYALSTAIEKTFNRWHLHLNLDYIGISGHKNFSNLYRNEMIAWLTAIEYNISRPVSVIVQIQGSTPMLHGLDITEWDDPPLDLGIGLGGTHQAKESKKLFFWKWLFFEDLNPNGPSIDISTTFYAGIQL
ncbi:DUF3187 family protein [Verrucomicrobiota bacterium]